MVTVDTENEKKSHFAATGWATIPRQDSTYHSLCYKAMLSSDIFFTSFHTIMLAARVLLYAPSHRQDSTYHSLCYTSRGALDGKRNSSMGPPHEGSIRRPIAPWANALTTELHLAPHLQQCHHSFSLTSSHTNNYSDTFTVFSPIHLCTSVILEDTTVWVLTAMPSQGFLTNLWQRLWTSSLHWMHLNPWRPRPQIRSAHSAQKAFWNNSNHKTLKQCFI